MAIDMCSETSPRISFSHDFCQSDVVLRIDNSSSLDSNSDFAFCLGGSSEHRSSTADELFSNGLLLPTQAQETSHSSSKQIHKPRTPHRPSSSSLFPPLPLHSSTENSNKLRLKDLMMEGNPSGADERPKKDSPSFWRFKRSSSLNCDASYKVSLICLLRSNSMGSVSNPRKDRQKQMPSVSMAKSVSPSSLPSQQKPPLKKNYGGCQGNNNGMASSLLLGMPPPYMSKGISQSLFGLGSLFRNGKNKKNSNKK